MYRIKNTADDRSKISLHRVAAKFELEPNLGGHRIRLGSYLDITPDHYQRVKPLVDSWAIKGMVEVSVIDYEEEELKKQEPEYNEKGLKLGGPTFEEWTSLYGYPAEHYPPEGYAEVFSPGLVAFRRSQEETKELSETGAGIIREALELPSITEQLLPPTPIQDPPPVPELPEPAPQPVSSPLLPRPSLVIPRTSAPPLPPLSVNKNKRRPV